MHKELSVHVLADGAVLLKSLEQVIDRLDVDADHIDLYRGLRDVARQKMTFYYDMADKACVPDREVRYEQLARDERTHFVLLEDLCRLLRRALAYQNKSQEDTHQIHAA